jgi:hypothetical protein
MDRPGLKYGQELEFHTFPLLARLFRKWMPKPATVPYRQLGSGTKRKFKCIPRLLLHPQESFQIKTFILFNSATVTSNIASKETSPPNSKRVEPLLSLAFISKCQTLQFSPRSYKWMISIQTTLRNGFESTGYQCLRPSPPPRRLGGKQEVEQPISLRIMRRFNKYSTDMRKQYGRDG